MGYLMLEELCGLKFSSTSLHNHLESVLCNIWFIQRLDEPDICMKPAVEPFGFKYN